MPTLTPSQAATMAEGVYRLRAKTITELQRVGQPLGCEGLFHVSDDARIQGRSGTLATALSGFGYIAEGEGTFSGELVCVTRGTQTTYDWASNANIGVQAGPGGHYVHAGFNAIWKSYREMLDSYLRGRNPSHIHCIGHSLGGALAFLNADYFTARRVAPVSVYTFGAPRSGTAWYAHELTQKIGADRIFRASHVADPVPMIPIFPFHHVPTSASGYTLGQGTGAGFISVGAHSMLTSYIPAASGRMWSALETSDADVTDNEVQSWLAATAQGNGVMAYSAEALRMIGRVLKWMLRKAGLVAAGTVSMGVTVGFTLLDRMAWLLARGFAFSKELATTGAAMVKAILRFLGHAAGTVAELTVRFLRSLLGLLFTRLGGMAQRALSLT